MVHLGGMGLGGVWAGDWMDEWKVGKSVVVENRGRRRKVEKSRKEEEGDRGVEL